MGKIGVIIDILDKNRCMIDGPVGRQVINFKRIKPTKFKLKIPRGLNSKLVHEKFINQKILKIWFESKWGKTFFKKKKKENFTDYDRFKFMLGKKYKNRFLPKNYLLLRNFITGKKF